jgi:hypothetical protein
MVMFHELTRRSALIMLSLLCCAHPTSAQNLGGDFDLNAENLILTIEDTRVTVMIDLLPLKPIFAALPRERMEPALKTLALKVVKLVEGEMGASDFNEMKHLSARFVYVNQRDEYNKPRPGGLQTIALVETDLTEGKPGTMTVDLK